MVIHVRAFDPRRCQLGEGPLWDDRRGRAVWVDILGARILGAGPDGEAPSELDLGSHVGFVALREGGGLLAGVRDGFWLLDDEGHVVAQHEVDPEPDRRFNDGAATPAGTVLAGTMAYDATADAGTLWAFDGRQAVPVLDGVTISNGLAWSADGRTCYYIDSGWNSVDAFDYEAAPDRLSARRTLVQVPEHDGTPDGMAIDAEGCLWVAMHGGGQVLRYSPEGRVLDRVVVPAPKVTSVAFVGSDLDRLLITTAAQGLDDDALACWPGSGTSFLADPGVRGRPAHRFAA